MVFILKHLTTGITAVLGENIKYTMGRSRRNSILLRDMTTKHRHAEIIIKDGIATIKTLSPEAVVFINGNKIDNETVLKPKDRIIFGNNNYCYSFFDPNYYVFLDDSIKGDEKESLWEVLRELKINIINYYSVECTHFVTSTLSLDNLKNTKILEHFLDKKYIVCPKFWFDMLKNIKDAAEIPNVYRCMPVLAQPLLEHGVEVFKCKKSTKTLFKDIPCVFFDKTLERDLGHIIKKCGGLTYLHDRKENFVHTLSVEINFNTALVITAKAPELSLVIGPFVNKLQEMNKKVYELSQDEIYFAVLKGKVDVIENNKTLKDLTINANNSYPRLHCLASSTPNERSKVTLKQNKEDFKSLERKAAVNKEKPSTSFGISDKSSVANKIIKTSSTPNKKSKVTLKRNKENFKSLKIQAAENKEKPSTSFGICDKSSVANKGIKRNEKLNTPGLQGSTTHTEEILNTSPIKISDKLGSPNKGKEAATSVGDGCNKDSELPKSPILNTTNRQNREKYLKRTSPTESGQKSSSKIEPKKRCDDSRQGSSKQLKINSFGDLKSVSHDDSFLNISYLNKIYKDVDLEPKT